MKVKYSLNNGKLGSWAEAGFISRLFFWWLKDILCLGYKRDLQTNDLTNQLPVQDLSDYLGSKLSKFWNNEVAIHKKPSLLRCVRQIFGFQYFLIGLLPLIEECGVRIIQPILVGIFINSLTNPQLSSEGNSPYLEGGLIILCSISNVFTTHWFYFSVQHVGMRARIACSSLIYKMSLKQFQISEGKIVNLLSNDVQRFDQSSVYLHYLWIAPLNLMIVFTILYDYYGFASIIGLLLLLVFSLLQGFLGVKFSSIRSRISSRTDQRLELLCSMLKKTKQIKMQCLEQIYSEKYQQLRRKELSYIKRATFIRAINLTFFYTSMKVIFVLVLWWYGKFDTQKIFVTISLLNNVRSLMLNYFPNGILQLAEARVSIKRIEEYLLQIPAPNPQLQNNYEDEKGKLIDNIAIDNHDQEAKPYIKFQNIQLKNENVLNLNVFSGEIINIVGSINSGKTTLLKTILGEIKSSNEDSRIISHGSIAYVPQIPWIFPGTMSENIILSRHFDPIWYKRVLESCSLKDNSNDHIRLENLSGGMRARIAIARAVYSKADIYLFDDPFVALDTSTKKFISSECILKLLDGKIRIICDGDGRLGKVISLNKAGRKLLRPTSIALPYSPIKLGNINSSLPGSMKEKRPIFKEIIENQEVKAGTVKWKTYRNYFTFGGSCIGLSFMIMVNIICQVSFIGSDYYLKIWESHEDFHFGMTVYGGIILSTFILFIIRAFTFFGIILSSAKNLHNKVFDNVLKAHEDFLQSYGKILNRFGKDTSLIDEFLPYTCFSALCVLLHVFGTVILISILQSFNIIPAIALCVVFYFLRNFYIRTGRAVRRIEALGRTPLFTLISATTSGSGLSTIQCYKAEQKFLDEFHKKLDSHSASWYINLATSRWFGFYLDWITIVYTTFVVGGFLIGSHVGADVGLGVSSVLFLSATFQLGARESAAVENQMISVERVLEYLKIPTEHFHGGSEIEACAPIVLENICVKYKDSVILKNMSLRIEKGEKVALLGQTGCGKSTLLKVLFRLVDYTGNVNFSGINSKDINLKTLRESLAIIPQESILFDGTLRQNLDPFNKLTDDEIYRIFGRFKSWFSKGLDEFVEEDGLNFSEGQKQIIGLIRVLLNKSEIIIMDEPGANLDPQTNALIKSTIEEFCADYTIITVAHRLRTVQHYDRAFQIVEGELIEVNISDLKTPTSTPSKENKKDFEPRLPPL